MDDIILNSQQKFSKIVEVVKSDLSTLRTGKATPQLIEHVVCEAYGAKMRLNELATISASDATTLLVTAFDSANLGAISKGIGEANLGLTAVIQDTSVRVIVPPLSQERRMEYVKLAKTKVEGGKVMVRQTRHEAMDDIVKSENDDDTKELLEKEIQKLTDNASKNLDIILAEKEKELMQV